MATHWPIFLTMLAFVRPVGSSPDDRRHEEHEQRRHCRLHRQNQLFCKYSQQLRKISTVARNKTGADFLGRRRVGVGFGVGVGRVNETFTGRRARFPSQNMKKLAQIWSFRYN